MTTNEILLALLALALVVTVGVLRIVACKVSGQTKAMRRMGFNDDWIARK